MSRIEYTLVKPAYKTDQYIGLSFRHSYLSLGKDQEINKYIKEETAKAIPPVQDRELIRFRFHPSPAGLLTINPFFQNKQGVMSNSYEAAGYSLPIISGMSQAMSRSVYIFELFDTNDLDKQVLLSRSYAKASDISTYNTVYSGSSFVTNTPCLQLATNLVANQLSVYGIPVYYAANKGEGLAYLRISFFNSITGKRRVLQKRDATLTRSEAEFIELVFNAQSRQYYISSTSTSLDMEEKILNPTSEAAKKETAGQNATSGREYTSGAYQPLKIEPSFPVVI